VWRPSQLTGLDSGFAGVESKRAASARPPRLARILLLFEGHNAAQLLAVRQFLGALLCGHFYSSGFSFETPQRRCVVLEQLSHQTIFCRANSKRREMGDLFTGFRKLDQAHGPAGIIYPLGTFFPHVFCPPAHRRRPSLKAPAESIPTGAPSPGKAPSVPRPSVLEPTGDAFPAFSPVAGNRGIS
jgi:hypothetical protein